MSIDKVILEKLIKLLQNSVKIKMEQLRAVLEMDQTTFNNRIIEWADEFGFIIDGDYLNVTKESAEGFINALDMQFESWEELEEKTRTKKETKEAIISFRGAQIKQFEADVLQEIENLANQVFEKVDNLKEVSRMGFTAVNNRVTGIMVYKSELTALPESIGNLKFLEYLIIRKNELQNIPESIGQLFSLIELRLSGNRLISLPNSIGNLKSLRWLNLERNQLESLPESIGNLRSLRELVLYDNYLKNLPNAIQELKLRGVKVFK